MPAKSESERKQGNLYTITFLHIHVQTVVNQIPVYSNSITQEQRKRKSRIWSVPDIQLPGSWKRFPDALYFAQIVTVDLQWMKEAGSVETDDCLPMG